MNPITDMNVSPPSNTENECISIYPVKLLYDVKVINGIYIQEPNTCTKIVRLERLNYQPLDLNSHLPLNCIRVAVARKDFLKFTSPIAFLEVSITYFNKNSDQSLLESNKPLYDLKNPRLLFGSPCIDSKISLLIRKNRQALFEFETFLEHIYNSSGHHTPDCSTECGLRIETVAKVQETLDTISNSVDPRSIFLDAVKDAKEVLSHITQSVERVNLQNETQSASKP